MRTLLDTHTFLWFIEADKQLSSRARDLIEDRATDVYLSIASAWEMAIKMSVGKRTLRGSLQESIAKQERENDIALLAISVAHLAQLTTFPMHHHDPFDRLLIAQAMTEGLSIISADSIFETYGVARIW